MRVTVALSLLMLLLGLVAGCDDDPTAIPADEIRGRVRLVDGSAAPAGTTVLLARSTFMFGLFFDVVDSTHTAAGGTYAIAGAAPGEYVLAAGRYGQVGASGWSHIGPFSDPVDVPAPAKVDEPVDLLMHPVLSGGGYEGIVVQEIDPYTPAAATEMTLLRLEGTDFAQVAVTMTDQDGAYRFEDIDTGNYLVRGYKEIVVAQDGPLQILSAESPILFQQAPGMAGVDTLFLADANVDEPVVYIYPETPGRFMVRLGLGRDVRLTASDPEYGDGWNVFVDADGRIDGRHDYLFYELGMPLPAIEGVGWCLDGADLETELGGLAARCGLNAAESAEFTAYWAERLPDSPHWLARPVFDADLDRWSTLDVAPAPDSSLRLWVFFVPADGPRMLPPPVVAPFRREGTTLVEWGGSVLPRPPA